MAERKTRNASGTDSLEQKNRQLEEVIKNNIFRNFRIIKIPRKMLGFESN